MGQAEKSPVPKASEWLACGEQIRERLTCEEQVERQLWSHLPKKKGLGTGAPNRLWPGEQPTVGGKRKASSGTLYGNAWLWHVLLPTTPSGKRGGPGNGKPDSEDDEVGNESSKSSRKQHRLGEHASLHVLAEGTNRVSSDCYVECAENQP